eukprot:8285089-Alexandrium_andersonii.AAC.1
MYSIRCGLAHGCGPPQIEDASAARGWAARARMPPGRARKNRQAPRRASAHQAAGAVETAPN